jgi:hypothetical protein
MATLTLRLVKGSPLTNSEVDNNFTALNTDVSAKLDTSTYTAADILTKIKTVDGVGSGLDADLLDGLTSATTNTVSTVVARDASGNFSAGTITASLTGTASLATSLAGGTAGSVPYQSAAGVTALLAAGTSGQLLQSTGTAVQWVTPASSIDASSVNGKTFGTFTTGGILYASSTTNAQSIGVGTSGQALVSNGTSAPTWATVGVSISDDTTNIAATFYPALSTITTGNLTSAVVSSTKLYYQPSTGTLNATGFNSLSDASLKTNVVRITNAVETIKKIDGVEFDWIENSKKSSGVIAQLLENILPHLVETNDVGIKSVNYAGLSAYLLESIKELNSRIEELEKHK